MEIKERIHSCLTDLEQKRQSVDTFQAKVRRLIDTLKTEGMTPGTVSELLQMLESVLKDYSEISASCQEMVVGLREIGDHITRIEDGRQKILTGVESILQNLTHLDRLAQNGMQVGAGTGKTPKRILLVRISPGDTPATTDLKNVKDSVRPAVPDDEDDADDEGPAGDTVVH